MSKIKARLDITADPPVLIDPRLCDQCGACIAICPANCLELDEFRLTIVGPDCIKCGFCIPACPVDALAWNEDSASGAGHVR
jgi:NAD-dependent dihydropyrimidine dehydrogenase PreA subunit